MVILTFKFVLFFLAIGICLVVIDRYYTKREKKK